MKKIIFLLLTAVLLTSCGTKPVATVGDIKITKGEFEWYLSSIKSQMNGTELQTDEDWENQEIEGEKAIDVAKQRALDIAVGNALYIKAAEAAGLKMTSEEEKQVSATKDRIVASYGGESAYKEYLKENNISDKFIEMMCKSTAYYNKIGDKISSENPVSEAEVKTYFEENKATLETEIRKAKHILIMTVDDATRQPLSEEERAAAKAQADELLSKVKSGEDFDKLMNEYSQDPGLTTAPDGYVFGSGEMVPEFEQATDSVGFGEIAFCESDFGYHIIKRLPIEFDDVKEQASNQIISERIDKQISDWETEFNIKVVRNEDVLKEIK